MKKKLVGAFLALTILQPAYASICKTTPDDTEIITCRFESKQNDNNCIDLPQSEGWTEEKALEFCSVQKDISIETLNISVGESCLVARGGSDDAKRCKVMDKSEEKIWYGYGMAKFVCKLFIKGDFEEGPFCTAYDTAE